MGKVFFDRDINIDGFIAGPNARPDNPHRASRRHR
jgi:hypothetical protein